MIYEDALSYIHSLLKFGVRPGLYGMDAILQRLGNPQNNLKYIHVAGTNGKGSVSTAMSSILINAGYNVGLYTSPYVTEFLERIQYNGKPVDKKVFADAVEKVKSEVEYLNTQNIVITEFEALTASAFLCFNEIKCDVVVLEVGLGGRLDATNVIKKADVDIITSLSFDHIAILGDTLEQIAFEKCGILRENANLILSANQKAEALNKVKEICSEKSVMLTVPDIDNAEIISSSVFGTRFKYESTEYNITMPGFHQVVNMTSVIEAVKVLNKKGYNINKENVLTGIKQTVLPARTEVICKEPLVVLDGGHNEDGAKAFFDTIKDELTEDGKLYVIAGMMADKAVETSLAPIMSKAYCFVSVTPENPRAIKACDLNKIAEKYCNNSIIIENVCNAVEIIYNKLQKNDILCVVGSLYLAGEVRETLIKTVKGEI